MTNSQQTNNDLPAIGIIQTSYTVAVTFSNKPSPEQRAKLKAAGYMYDRGRWFRNMSDSKLATQDSVDDMLAA